MPSWRFGHAAVPAGQGVSFGDEQPPKLIPKVVLAWLVHPTLGQFVIYLSLVLLLAGRLPELAVCSAGSVGVLGSARVALVFTARIAGPKKPTGYSIPYCPGYIRVCGFQQWLGAVWRGSAHRGVARLAMAWLGSPWQQQ